ncbi:MAG: large conductance mechanosensitive channel protein MscL [Bacteroidia bacterium]|nr:large conductance mechanosensitive channel protein MscL [Bacteroidia bacterium]
MKLFKEFKEFISRGNVLQLAVGVIIGGAFSAIVGALVNHILMPVIGLAVNGGLDSFYTILPNSVLADVQDGTIGVLAIDGNYYTSLSKIDWGLLINAVINFFLIALVLFVVIKVFASIQKAGDKAAEKLHKKNGVPEPKPEPEPEPKPSPDVVLLTEIRDLLKKDK